MVSVSSEAEIKKKNVMSTSCDLFWRKTEAVLSEQLKNIQHRMTWGTSRRKTKDGLTAAICNHCGVISVLNCSTEIL